MEGLELQSRCGKRFTVTNGGVNRTRRKPKVRRIYSLGASGSQSDRFLIRSLENEFLRLGLDYGARCCFANGGRATTMIHVSVGKNKGRYGAGGEVGGDIAEYLLSVGSGSCVDQRQPLRSLQGVDVAIQRS